MELAACCGYFHGDRLFAGFAAYYIARLPRLVKGVLDVVLTLPLVLAPPSSVICCCGCWGKADPRRVKRHVISGVKVVMTWWSAIFATAVVIFPLMYRTARGAFENPLTRQLDYSGQTLGLSNAYIFWHIRMPCCRQGS